MNVELRGGELDGSVVFNLENIHPGSIIRIPKPPTIKPIPNETWSIRPTVEVFYIVTDEQNKNGDMVADIRKNS